VGILKDLLDLSPPVLFCVIDGLEILEDQRTRQPLADFIDALHGHDGNRDDTQVSKQKLKILFTTAWEIKVSSGLLGRGGTCLCRKAQHRP